MKRYRITKYNPAFRDDNGRYTLDEWTSISDVGKTFFDGVLTLQKYQQTEDAYIESIKTILKSTGISELRVINLEKGEIEEIEEVVLFPEERKIYDEIKENACLQLKEIEAVARIVLRELMWCRLCSDIKKLQIEFGYDYYMYIKCEGLDEQIIRKIMEKGLFVELV